MSTLKFTTIADGWVTQRQPDTPTAVAAGSRCALTREGEIVCSFLVQSKLGINDFKPMLARSADGGVTWGEPVLLWPQLQDRYSLFGVVSAAPNGDLFYYGSRYVIDQPGESFWSEATQGLKPNDLVWARSTDSGRTWPAPTVIPMPVPGAAETAMALCVTRGGHWACCYSPYNTFDPAVQVDRRQVVALVSRDQGRTWRHTSMLRFPEGTAAEAWLVELSDGRLLGTSWHMREDGQGDHPNAYALSSDGGLTWTPTRSTGIQGQSTALAALPDGRALFIYNQRQHGEPGVWLAVVRPVETDFGVQANEIVWRAETRTQRGTSGEHTEWQDFSFGEPAVTVLRDGTLLVTLWCVQPNGQGIRFVKLRMDQ
ncbi:exo-alpha-sialidase [bacterium]|nr:exo-alpha-sialidase [bacterium]